jgi:hypothetical protein
MPEDNPQRALPRFESPFLCPSLLCESAEQLAVDTQSCGNPAVPLPQLNKLRELRDALVVLKGPLAEKPGMRESIERAFFNNEVNDRVLGERVCSPRDIYRPAG